MSLFSRMNKTLNCSNYLIFTKQLKCEIYCNFSVFQHIIPVCILKKYTHFNFFCFRITHCKQYNTQISFFVKPFLFCFFLPPFSCSFLFQFFQFSNKATFFCFFFLHRERRHLIVRYRLQYRIGNREIIEIE